MYPAYKGENTSRKASQEPSCRAYAKRFRCGTAAPGNEEMANWGIVKYKGLSNLQRSILALAEKQGGDVFAREVLISFFGFKPCRSIFMRWPKPGSLVFRKSSIGCARYNAKTVSVCKSFNRLVRRRLAERIPGGIRLTGINKE